MIPQTIFDKVEGSISAFWASLYAGVELSLISVSSFLLIIGDLQNLGGQNKSSGSTLIVGVLQSWIGSWYRKGRNILKLLDKKNYTMSKINVWRYTI